MAFVVEDGTGLSNSNAYASVAWVDEYHSTYGNLDWSGSEEQKQAWIVQGAEYLDLTWGTLFQGMKKEVDPAQALEWPREYVYDDETGVEVNPDAVPELIKRANAELALVAKRCGLYPATDQPGVRQRTQTAGKLSVSILYSGSQIDVPIIRKVKLLLRGLLKASAGGQARLVRA